MNSKDIFTNENKLYIVKRLYVRKSFLQHDLAKNKLNILTFFAMGLFFLTNLANFGRVSAPEIFLRETMVNKRIWIIEDNYHMKFIA